jgi:hypothetical protein
MFSPTQDRKELRAAKATQLPTSRIFPVTLQLSRALLTQLLRRLNKLERGDPFRRAAADVRYVS